MDDLVAFLRARADEDEATVRANLGDHGLGDDGGYPDYQTYSDEHTHAANDFLFRFKPPRMLREVEAKRRIIDELVNAREAHRRAWANYLAWTQNAPEPYRDAEPSDGPDKVIGGLQRAVILLALPYSDHPDYRDEWRP